MFKKSTIALFLFLFSQSSISGGVSLGATRLIYPTDKDQVTLKVFNSDEKDNYLVQSWVSDEKHKKSTDFIITPPLFVLKAGTDNLLRVVYTGDKDKLPKDRETMLFLNSKVIPSLNEQQKAIDNALMISTTTKIKLFIRPSSIKEDSFTSYEKLTCQYENGKIKINNPSPFYMNLVFLSVNKKTISDAETIPPKSSVTIASGQMGTHVSYNFINDYGVQVKDKKCNLQAG